MRRFLLVGLTGGIATGKSAVAATLEGPGVRIVDADALAREVVEPGTLVTPKIAGGEHILLLGTPQIAAGSQLDV